MMQFPRWRVDVTVGGDLVKTLYETATTAAAAIDKAKYKMRGAVSSAGAFRFRATKVEGAGPERHHATKKSGRQFTREINEALAKPQGSVSSTGKRSAHATKSKTGDKTTDKTDIAALASMFGLPDWDSVDEMNQQNYWEAAKGEEDEEAQQAAEAAAQDDVYAQWYDAVEHAASKLFEKHGLELKPAGKWHPSTYAKTKAERRPFQLKIVPSKSWDDAANKLRETINGVGYFHFNSLRDFLDSGPYTARQAVLSHLGYIKQQPDVYGEQSARSLYDRHWR